MSAIVSVPVNVSAITLGDGAHVPVNNQLTDASDADVNLLVYEPSQPVIVVPAQPGSQNCTISMPPNVTSITVNGNVYNPDGTLQNKITGPQADFTLVVTQGFNIVTENS